MQKELIISTTPQETKIAILEDDELVEYYIERHRSQGIVGNIYKGKVTKVLPGMQSAFVDIGLERDAFLYVSDFMELEDQDELEEVPTGRPSPEPRYQEAEPVTTSPAAPAEQSDESEATENPQNGEAAESRDRGNWRSRRRRRGRRGERFQESKFARPVEEPQRAER